MPAYLKKIAGNHFSDYSCPLPIVIGIVMNTQYLAACLVN